MSFVFIVLLCLLTISLYITSPLLSLSQPLASSSNLRQSSDEETVRELTTAYGMAIAAGDLDTMRQLWNPQSPNQASRLRVYQGQFSNTRIEFTDLKVTRLAVMGDKAISDLTADGRLLDKKTGGIFTTRDAFHGSCRSFEWAKTTGGWKIEREVVLQEDLAARLEAADSEKQRHELLEKEKALVTDVLIDHLNLRGHRHRF